MANLMRTHTADQLAINVAAVRHLRGYADECAALLARDSPRNNSSPEAARPPVVQPHDAAVPALDITDELDALQLSLPRALR